MSGVNLIDFVMPVAIPAPAGKSEGVKRVGGFHLSVPRKKVQHENATEAVENKGGEKVEWWKPLLPLLGILILFKLATWFVRRDKR